MAVRVRLFAALRDAAGVAHVDVEAGPVVDLLAGLRERFGEPFTSRLARSKVVLGDEEVAATSTRPVPDGAEVALLPPFSGG